MSSSIPHTPPSGKIGNSSQKPVPHFQLPEQTPKTPRKKSSQFITPSRGKNGQLKTPKTTEQPKGGSSRIADEKPVTLCPPTPDFTPQRSPRSSRKKRLNMVDLFESAGPLEHMGMFIPNHSTVGSGRKVASPMKSLRAPLALELSELSKINENLTFEEDLFDESILQSPTKRPRRRLTSLSETPGAQIITDEKVNMWHGNSFKNAFSSDEESDCGSSGPALVNPFVSSSKVPTKQNSKNVFGKSSRGVDYSTHNEYINHRTGERKVEELSESQKKFRPKKIDFSGI